MKKFLHTDVETVGGFDHLARTIWSIAWIVTDGKGNELSRKAFLISEALPFLAGDTFWSKRKNSMMCRVLADYVTVTASEMFEALQKDMDDCEAFVAFNSRFERGAFVNFSRAFRLEPLRMASELDLALYAFDVLPLSQYAAYAKEHNLKTESGKSWSSKCEHILAWLGLTDVEHSHLALDDTLTQVDLFKACLATKKRRPAYGATLTHFAHPAWKKWLRIEPDADQVDGSRYVKA